MYLKTYRSIALAVALGFAATLSPAHAAPFDQIEIVETASLANFQKVYIAPVKVELADTKVRRTIRDIRSDRPVSDIDKTRRATETHKHMVRAFSKNFEIVDTPTDDALTVETVITKLTSTRPTIADTSANVGLSFNSIYAGGADFDVRIKQGTSLLAEISDSYQTRLNDGRPRVGTWQDYTYVSRRFSRKLAKYTKEN